MYRLKFEIFVTEEPENKLQALEEIKEAIRDYQCPEEFVVWREEKE